LDVQTVHPAMGTPVGVLVGPVTADLLALEPLPLAEASLEEGLVDVHIQSTGLADDPSGVVSTGEWVGYDLVLRLRDDRRGQHRGLPSSRDVQWDVDLPLQARHPVVLGLPVTNQYQARAHIAAGGGSRLHESPSPPSAAAGPPAAAGRSSPICRSITGASRHRRSRA